MPSTNLLRVGIVGCGLIGNKRAKVLKEDPSSYLCAAADINVNNAACLMKNYGKKDGKYYQNWQEMLTKEELNVLIVATPNNFLKEVSLAAIEKGIHVLCEKPLGRNLKESIDMAKAVKGKKVILKTGFNHRHHPAIGRAYELSIQGAIGTLMYVRAIYGHGGRPGYEKEWRAKKEISGGGELLDQGIHVMDLFRWFLGDFDEVFGRISTYYWKMEVEDNAFALLKSKNGQTALMHSSWTQWKNRFSFEIYGEGGYLSVEGLGGSYGLERLEIGRRKAAGGPPEVEVLEFPGPDVSWANEWQEFVSAIRENREPMGNFKDGLEAMRMIDAVYRSASENRPVKLSEFA